MSEFPTFHSPDIRVQPIMQAAGTEDCFSAITASVFGLPAERLSEVQTALQDAYVLNEDGSTSPPYDELVVTLSEQQLTITPVIGPFNEADDTADALTRISQAFSPEAPMAVTYIKPDKPSYHWVMLAGADRLPDGSVDAYYVMNPEEPEIQRVAIADSAATDDITRMIERSLAGGGVFAYTLQVGSTPTA